MVQNYPDNVTTENNANTEVASAKVLRNLYFMQQNVLKYILSVLF